MDLTNEEWHLIEACIGSELRYIREWLDSDDKAGRKAEEGIRNGVCRCRADCERLLRNIASRESLPWIAPLKAQREQIRYDHPNDKPLKVVQWESVDLF
jgi:hypothetical protein